MACRKFHPKAAHAAGFPSCPDRARNRIERRTTTMPKMKTHRGAAKRFSLTKTGKVKHKQMNANHQVHLKTTKRTRHLRADGIIDNTAEAKTIRKLIPYK